MKMMRKERRMTKMRRKMNCKMERNQEKCDSSRILETNLTMSVKNRIKNCLLNGVVLAILSVFSVATNLTQKKEKTSTKRFTQN